MLLLGIAKAMGFEHLVSLLSTIKKAPYISILLALCVAVEVWAAQQFFRYRNDQGVIVLDYQVPTHLVKNGYEVISPSGQVVEVVPPYQEQSDEELQAAKQLELQQQEDRLLLKSYSSLEELYSARDRKLEGLQKELEILTANISETNMLLDKERAKAAEFQRSGRILRPAMVEYIDRLMAEVTDGKHLLAIRQQEYKAVASRYQHYVERLKVLFGVEASEEKSHSSSAATDPATSPLGGE